MICPGLLFFFSTHQCPQKLRWGERTNPGARVRERGWGREILIGNLSPTSHDLWLLYQKKKLHMRVIFKGNTKVAFSDALYDPSTRNFSYLETSFPFTKQVEQVLLKAKLNIMQNFILGKLQGPSTKLLYIVRIRFSPISAAAQGEGKKKHFSPIDSPSSLFCTNMQFPSRRPALCNALQ